MQVVTDTAHFLSLSGATSSYSGGAHGALETHSLVWDKKLGRRLNTTDVFVSPIAIQSAFGSAWCARLAAARTDRTVSDATRDTVFPCPPVKDLTLLLGSSSGARIDRIGLIADQYVAGSYAEGPYEVTLPVDRRTLAAVKPAYRADFASR